MDTTATQFNGVNKSRTRSYNGRWNISAFVTRGFSLPSVLVFLQNTADGKVKGTLYKRQDLSRVIILMPRGQKCEVRYNQGCPNKLPGIN